MTEPARLPWHGAGMLLLQAGPDQVASWAQRGLMPVHVVPLDGWTAVLTAGPSQATPPYDDTLETLAGRPVPSRLRPAIGLFRVEDNAVVSTQRSGWRAPQRWFVWSPGEGVVRPPELVAGRPADLVAAAGSSDGGDRRRVRDRADTRRVRDILVDGRGDAVGVLRDLMALLALPGFDLLEGGQDPRTVPGSTVVEPGEQHVARFERTVSDDARHRAELEED